MTPLLVISFSIIAIFAIIYGLVAWLRTYTHCPHCGRWASIEESNISDNLFIVCRHCEMTTAKED